ncbi:DUF4307 domain-containing protein [Antrihabitans stalactiti]|jgi:hypothetical protein|uniref:DUF4307 domain-containing protein n=1 Tax=Antrihabitans stalactiti TaxID=2584121 RepID=A0A848KG70_9NOCA|nr:DUF4307 domain-containing protein [Antrihabitans stalactiti]NMN96766.1 DUF4307 domain-containing protein [Antrihabitans stalactiti]
MVPTSAIPPRPADRYGPPPRHSRWIPIALGVVVVLIGIGIAYLGFLRFGPQELASEEISYDAVNSSTLSMKFTVTRKDPSRAVVCIIRARSQDGTETGRREVYVGPSENGTVEVNSTVRTSQPPAAGDVYGCSFDPPAYLKAD